MAAASDAYLALCDETPRIPDVFEFLESHPDLGADGVLDVLLIDQNQRWKRNQTIPVVQYLERLPELSDRARVELLIEEYGYLEERGVAPEPEAFAIRYERLVPGALSELRAALELEDRPGPLSETLAASTSPSGTRRERFQIGRYEVLHTLGKGAFGEVFYARDPELDRSVAIKVPASGRLNDTAEQQAFLAEARAVAKLDHPGIVPVYDCGVDDEGRVFVVSRYVRGKELRSAMRNGLPFLEAARIVARVARALHAAHGAGIVHRDVKPGNIMLDAQGEPHVLDFGLALHGQDYSGKDALVGTPAYMSPEQALGETARLDGRSDIYSLGVILYEMLAGHRPCRSDQIEALLEHARHGEIRPPRQSNDAIPAELEQICLTALQRQMRDRYSTALDMAEALEAWIANQESSVGGGSSRAPQAAEPGEASSSSLTNPSTASSGHSIVGRQVKTGRWLAWGGVAVAVAAMACAWVWGLLPGAVGENNDRVSDTDQGGNGTATKQTVPDETAAPKTAAAWIDEGVNRVAVMGFQNLAGSDDSQWMSIALAELMVAELQKSPQLNVLSNETIALSQADLDVFAFDPASNSARNRIHKRLNADWIVVGSIAPAHPGTEQAQLDIVLLSERDPALSFESTVKADGESWTDLVPMAASQMRAFLGLSAPDLAKYPEIHMTLPAPSAAVPDYYRGLAALRQFDAPRALHHLELALQLAPDSAGIHDLAARAHQQLGNDRQARAHSDSAVSFSERLPAWQRWEFEARNRLLAGQPGEAVARFRQLVEFRNGSVDATLELARSMIEAGQGREALDQLEQLRTRVLSDAELAQIDLVAATACQSVSEFGEQLRFAESAGALALQAGARLHEAAAQLLAGEAHRRIGKHESAVAAFDRAAELFERHGDKQRLAQTWSEWGKALVDHGDLERAAARIQKGLDLSREIGNRRLVARHTGQLGEVGIYRGDFALAESQLRDAIAQFVELGDRKGVADMSLTLANVVARGGNTEEAVELIETARREFQASGDRRGEARTWGQQGAVYGRMGEVGEAQRHFERALELFREVGDRRGEATCLGDLASTWSNRGELKKAAEMYSDALELQRQLASRRGPALLMYNLGVLWYRTGKTDEAIRLVRDAWQTFSAEGNRPNACFVRRKLGELVMIGGDLNTARDHLEAALEESRTIGSKTVEATALASLAAVMMNTGQLAEARQALVDAREIRKGLGQKFNVAAVDLMLARIALLEEDAAAALALTDRAFEPLVLDQAEWKPMVLAFRARVLAALDRAEAAREAFDASTASLGDVTSEDVSMELTIHHERARALAQMDDREAAVALFDQVIHQARQQGSTTVLVDALVERAETRHRNKAPLSDTDLAEIHELATTAGYLVLAERVEALRASTGN